MKEISQIQLDLVALEPSLFVLGGTLVLALALALLLLLSGRILWVVLVRRVCRRRSNRRPASKTMIPIPILLSHGVRVFMTTDDDGRSVVDFP